MFREFDVNIIYNISSAPAARPNYVTSDCEHSLYDARTKNLKLSADILKKVQWEPARFTKATLPTTLRDLLTVGVKTVQISHVTTFNHAA